MTVRAWSRRDETKDNYRILIHNLKTKNLLENQSIDVIILTKRIVQK